MSVIYLNHAGTSWPKPPEVISATNRVMKSNPLDWATQFAAAHSTVARFFHVDRSRLLLTPSCTAAIQLGIQDLPWEVGDRVLTSHFEHHALMRSLRKLETFGVSVTLLPHTDDTLVCLERMEEELQKGSVRLLALTAACNVTGQLLPVKEAIELAQRYGAKTLVDGAQAAGWWDIDVNELGVDLFAFAGHKGPQAPWGVGGLFIRPGLSMNCPTASCDVSTRSNQTEESPMPGYCDAGSVNLSALAGLDAACHWLSSPAASDRLEKARAHVASFTCAVRELSNIEVYHDVPAEMKVPTVAINIKGLGATKFGAQLKKLGIITSAGFQCAPEAHRALGTTSTGVVRFSFGPSTTASEVDTAIDSVRTIAKSV